MSLKGNSINPVLFTSPPPYSMKREKQIIERNFNICLFAYQSSTHEGLQNKHDLRFICVLQVYEIQLLSSIISPALLGIFFLRYKFIFYLLGKFFLLFLVFPFFSFSTSISCFFHGVKKIIISQER